MNLLLLKALAVALTVSQILTQDKVETAFSPTADRAKVRSILRQGCAHIRGVLGEEVPAFKKVDPAKFLEMQIANAQVLGQSTELMPGLEMADAKTAYELFCSDEDPERGDKILNEVIGFYNLAMYDLPDIRQITETSLTSFSHVLDAQDQPLTDLYRSSRRKYAKLSEIPELVKKAFLSAEDQDFYQHPGIDERGVLRAGMRNFMSGGGKREQGGSTITQQLVKNMLLSGEVTYERKMREMVLAFRLEKAISKDQILELYLNYVLLGRSSWGVALAAESYFGKPLAALSPAQAAFLAGMPKGPAYYNPDKNSQRSIDRTLYVLEQMKKNGALDEATYAQAVIEAQHPVRIAYVAPVTTTGGHFLDEMADSVRDQYGQDPRESPYEIHSTLDVRVQKGAEAALQEGLAQWELRVGRAKFSGAEGNLGDAVKQAADAGDATPWLTALKSYRPKLDDVAWPSAIVTQVGGKGLQVGLTDGQVYGLRGGPAGGLKALKLYDVVFVQPNSGGKSPTADLRFRPELQGATVILENATGRVVALVGGFSHGASRWNRAADMIRQPGSLAKPLTYLIGLNSGLQPNTMIYDAAITVPSPDGTGPDWSPSIFDSNCGGGTITMRRGLENSCNRVTARVAASMGPVLGLDQITRAMKECGFQPNPIRYWPVILGSQETSVLNVATCYATIANGGLRPVPHLYRQIKKDGNVLFDESRLALTKVQVADPVSFFQLRNLMQGVMARGTAADLNNQLKDVVAGLGSRARLSEFIAGKTGTSQGSNDTWFASITQDLTIVTWIGYDNATNKTKKTLGDGTGGSVAAPIFGRIYRATLEAYPPRRFAPPTPEVAALVAPMAVSGSGYLSSLKGAGAGSTIDYFRLDVMGRVMDTKDNLMSFEPPPPPPVEDNYYDPYYQE